MKTSVTIDSGQATIQGTVPAKDMEPHFTAAAREAAGTMTVKGFRPGKVPYETVVKSVGEETILQGATSRALRSLLPRIYDEHNIEPIDEPQITVKKIAKDNPFEFELIVPVLPDVTLPSFDELSVDRKKVVISDEELSLALKQLQESRAKKVTMDRAAAIGDRIEIDFTIKMDGVTIEGGESKNHPIVLGHGHYLPGFEEAIVGMKAGETKEFELTAPDDYHGEQIAGKIVQSSVTLNIVQERELPELNDAFAAALGDFKTLDDLRSSISGGLLQENEKKEDQRVRIKLIESVAKDMKTDVPPLLVERELTVMADEFEHSVASFGVSFDDYLKHLKKTKEDLKEDWKVEATKRVRIGLALHAIAKQERITVDPAEVEKRVNETLKQYGSEDEAKGRVDVERLTAYTRSIMTNDNVFDYLEKKATINIKN